MPSTVVHLALGALLAAALLGDEFDERSLAVVLVVVAIPDLDTFLGILVPGTHRAAFHTLLIPAVAAGLVAYDTRFRARSAIRSLGERSETVAWVAVAAYLLAGIGPDLFFNGVNVFYPLVDRFVALSGEVYLSNERGLVQTVWEFESGRSPIVGTTDDVHYTTGIDHSRGPDPADVERVFPLAMNGLELLLVLTATVVTTVRLWVVRDR